MKLVKDYAKVDGRYPYKRPEVSSIIIDGLGVYDLLGDPFYPTIEFEGKSVKVNDFLKATNRPFLEDMHPVAAYGANVNPHILSRQFGRIGLSGTVPIIKASASGFDVVHGSYVTKAGSIPAQLVHSDRTEPEIWLNLFTKEQLLAQHKTEKLGKGNYFFGEIPISVGEKEMTIYCYFGGEKPTFIDPEEDMPLAFASADYKGEENLVVHEDFVPIEAKGRAFPEIAQIEMFKIFNDAANEEFGEVIYSEPGILSSWGTGYWNMASDYIQERFGNHLENEVNRVENPFEIDSLKKLKDCL